MADDSPKPKAKRKAKPKGKRGGSRPGAGRKTAEVTKFRADVEKATRDLVVDRIPELLDNLVHLANGGYQRVKESWEPAGLVMVDAEVEDVDGNPVYDARGCPVTAKRPAFPEIPPDKMVCTSRTTETADCDRAANEYLINRVLGRPKQALEISGEDGSPLKIEIVYVDAHRPAEDAEPAPGPAEDPGGTGPV